MVWPAGFDVDEESGAAYWLREDRDVARTVSVSDTVMVDVDADGNVVGVEFASPAPPADEVWTRLFSQFPGLDSEDSPLSKLRLRARSVPSTGNTFAQLQTLKPADFRPRPRGALAIR